MRVVEGLANLTVAERGGVIALGNFDGVHRGHQSILLEAIAQARRLGAKSGAIAFEPHARQFFQPAKPMFRLTPLDMKLGLFEALGLDLTVVLAFDAALAGLSAREFVERILVASLGVRHVVIGYDFFFGQGRQGSPDTLRQLAGELGFGLSVMAPAGDSGEIFSSTRVRELLAEGHVRDAAEALGHWWRVKGTVVSGAHIGTGMGFPTANIHLPPGLQLHHGIYAVRVHVASTGKRHGGAAYLGTRPTFDNGRPVLEVFLFEFSGNLYGTTIEIELLEFIRADRKFKSAEELMAQMGRDCEAAAAVIAKVEADDPMAAYPLGRALARR